MCKPPHALASNTFSQIQTEKYVQDIGRKVTVHQSNEDDEYYDEEEAQETQDSATDYQ